MRDRCVQLGHRGPPGEMYAGLCIDPPVVARFRCETPRMDRLDEVAPAFVEMAHRIVWATAATVDPTDRPRTRILHPLWEWDGEGLSGWVATGPTPVKRADLERSPHMSLNYWNPEHDTCTADCRATWHLDPD